MTYSSNSYLSEYGTEMTANANYIYTFFKGKGWTKNAISAMLGNMQRESTINPGIWQNLDEGNTSLGIGLVQWTPATKLINWCNSNNKVYTSIQAQCEKIYDEFVNGGQWIATSNYPESFKEFSQSTKSIEYLTYCFLKNYERAGVEAIDERITHATYWFNNVDATLDSSVQYLLFPLTHIRISQDEKGDHSHQGMLAIDFLGWDDNGRVYECPYYAPCDCKLVSTANNGATVIWESLEKVRCADGSLSYVCWVQAHDNNPFPKGTIKKQGEVIGHTGTAGNVTGDHVHLNVAKGKWSECGWATNSYGVSYIKNECHIYDVMYIKSTVKIIDGKGHDWKVIEDWEPEIDIKKKKKHKYKFVLFNRRIRNG